MADRVSIKQRSAIMRKVGTRDTGPEILVRRYLHARGFRYVLNDTRLPGRPDLVFPKHKAVVFVHGCFWHGHDCSKGRLPKSNLTYWKPKIAENRKRDGRNLLELAKVGWRGFTIWQCQLRKPDSAIRKVVRFLERLR